jgi:hypothetical protein
VDQLASKKRLQERPGEPEHEEQRAEVGHQEVLGHVAEHELLAYVCDRGHERRHDHGDTRAEAGDAPRRHRPALAGECSRAHPVGGQRGQRGQELKRLQYPAADVRERNGHCPRGYASGGSL